MNQPPRTAIRRAIGAERPVMFRYRDRDGEPSFRAVSPYELREAPERVLGFDHGRGHLRHFRVERIEGPVRSARRAVDYRPPAGELS